MTVINAPPRATPSATMGVYNRVSPATRQRPGLRPKPRGGLDVPNDTCSINEYPNPAKHRGWCNKHYTRWRRHGDPLAVMTPKPEPCSVDDCDTVSNCNGMCIKHYRRWKRHGDPQTTYGYTGGVPGVCSVDGCDREFYARSWCRFHYRRWRQQGDANWQPPTVAQRFWRYVDPPATPDGCWNWDAFAWAPRGRRRRRGRFGVDGDARTAHRVAYELMVGPIPEGLDVDHLCRNPLCVNPAHLDAVTNAENNERQHLSSPEHRAIVPGHIKESIR